MSEHGLCRCGCGGEPNLAPYTKKSAGLVKGEPRQFINGHQRIKRGPGPNPGGLCLCGCGEKTPVALKHAHGNIKGSPTRFVPGHQNRTRTYDLIGHAVIDRGYDTPCWEWQGTESGSRKTKYGYKWDATVKRMRPAHVMYWEQENGPVPSGLELDHLCRNKKCVRPDHCEPVTHIENVQRFWRFQKGG